MAFTVDIDTGGTFTDGLFADGKEIKRVKVDTTPHDLTVSWLNCMREGAEKFGFATLGEFLEQVDIVRWSNTVASNVIVEHKGPKLGLFVTDGYQKTLYSSASKSPVFGHLIEEANVEAVKLPFETDELLIQIKKLLEKGVRRICISLKDGLRNIKDEMRIKDTMPISGEDRKTFLPERFRTAPSTLAFAARRGTFEGVGADLLQGKGQDVVVLVIDLEEAQRAGPQQHHQHRPTHPRAGGGKHQQRQQHGEQDDALHAEQHLEELECLLIESLGTAGAREQLCGGEDAVGVGEHFEV